MAKLVAKAHRIQALTRRQLDVLCSSCCHDAGTFQRAEKKELVQFKK
jgi:hypothetical protein